MTVAELLGALRERGIEPRVVGDRLRCIAPQGAMTPELAQQVRNHKLELLELLTAATESANRAPAGSIPRAQQRERYPLSFTQERNLYAALHGPGLPYAFRVTGKLNASALHETLQHIVNRHDPLRTVFLLDGEQPAQQVLPKELVPFTFTDLSKREKSRNAELTIQLEELGVQPFDLTSGPLIRLALFKMGELEHVLAMVVSQMAFDGSSLDVFLSELREGYAALSAGRAWPLTELRVDYVDYVAWHRQLVASRRPAQTAFWNATLGVELPPGPLPTDKPRPVVASYRGGTIPFEVPPDLALTLRELAQANGSTLHMVLLTAFYVFLARVGDVTEVVVASPIEGRTDPSLEGMVGAFANRLLLRIPVDRSFGFLALLGQVKDHCLNAYENQDLPIDQLNVRVARGQERGFVPVCQVEFSFQAVSSRSARMGSVTLEPFHLHSGRAAQELTLWLEDEGHRVSGSFDYSRDLFEAETIAHWAECLLQTLRGIGSDPNQAVGTLDLLSNQRSLMSAVVARARLNPPVELVEALGRTGTIRILDKQGQGLPLGAYGSLELGGVLRWLPGQIRLTATGRLEVRPTNEPEEPTVPVDPDVRQDAIDVAEFRIIEEFGALLGAEQVGLHQSFFDLGGHSMTGVKLLERIHSYFGARLALGALFEAPTPYLLARLVRAEAGLPDPETGETIKGQLPRWCSVVPIQPRGALPPFFAAAGVGGNPMNLRHLAKYLGPEQPFFGLQHRGTDGRLPPHRTVHSMAQEYLEHIREVQPKGPYYLGGFSAGGVAVYEVAQMLRAQGETVGLLVMFDANSPLVRRPSSTEKRSNHRQQLAEQGPRYLVETGLRTLSGRIENWRLHGAARLAPFFPYRFRNEAVTISWERALQAYLPKPYEGEVLVLRARLRDNWIFDETNGWAPLTGPRLEIITVEGGHTSHVDPPYARGTADCLRTALARARFRASQLRAGVRFTENGAAPPSSARFSDSPRSPRTPHAAEIAPKL